MNYTIILIYQILLATVVKIFVKIVMVIIALVFVKIVG